ncbi:MAG: HRDC domain-containing protein [Planctomycetia bacterium]
MPYRVFVVPVRDPEQVGVFNGFLSSQRILNVEKRFVDAGENSFWTFCVEFLPAQTGGGGVMARPGRIDYKEVLEPEQYLRYLALKRVREEVAAAEAVPVFKIFTNEQLAEMVKRKVSTLAALDAIPGVGKGRVESYGARFLAALGDGRNEAGGKPVSVDPGV